MIDISTIAFAFIGGLLPALLWLYFWLKEDARCPEPRHLILLAFIAGMVTVPLVLPFQKWAIDYFGVVGPDTILAWAAAEEILKYALVAITVLWRRAVNEPIDPMMYMITGALGFAALENTLFLINPLTDGNLIDGFITGNLRFLGATLLHVLASAIVGFTLAISFYMRKRFHVLFATIGLILAILLHTIFNLLIISGEGIHTLTAFFFVWIGIVILFVLFEIAKYIRLINTSKNKRNTC